MAIALVQKKKGSADATTCTLTFDSAPTQGNTLIAIAQRRGGAAFTSGPSGWSPLYSVDVTSFGGHAAWYKVAGASEPSGATVTPDASATVGMQIFEYSGLDPTPLDQTQTNNGGGAENAPPRSTGTTGTTTQADELIIASIGVRAVEATAWSWSNSFTHEDDIFANHSSPLTLGVATRVVSATGTYETSASWTAATAWAGGGIATFKAAVGGPILATVDELSLTEQTAVVSSHRAFSAASESLTIQAFAASVNGGATLQATSQAFEITERHLLLRVTFQAEVAELSITPQAASLSSLAQIEATSVSLDIEAQSAVVLAATALQGTSQSLDLTEQAAVVGSHRTVAAASASLTLSAQDAATNFANAVAASVDELSLSALAATVSIGGAINASTDSLDIETAQALVSLHRTFAATSQSLSLTQNAAEVWTGSNIGATSQALDLTANAAVVLAATALQAATSDSLTLTERAANISLGSGIGASSQALTLTAFAAGTSLPRRISAALDALALTEYAASVSGSGLVDPSVKSARGFRSQRGQRGVKVKRQERSL